MLGIMFVKCPVCGESGGVHAFGHGEGRCDWCGAEGQLVRTEVTMETVGEDGATTSRGNSYRFDATPPILPEGDWATIIREFGIGDLLFTVPLAAELRARGLRVCYRCPRERFVLVRHVADAWQAVGDESPPRGKIIDLRGVADDGRPLDDVNRPEAYCQFAGIEAQEYRFWSVPTVEHHELATAIREAWGEERVTLLCPKASSPNRDMPAPEEVAVALQLAGWKVVNLADRVHPLQGPEDGAARRMALDDLVASVLAADVVVSADSGPLHLASSYRTPCVGVFATEDPMLRLRHQTGWVGFAPGAFDAGEVAGAALRVYHDPSLAEVIRGESQ